MLLKPTLPQTTSLLSDPKLLASHFPALDTEQAAALEQKIKDALPNIHPSPVALNSVLLSLKQAAQPENAPFNNDPPVIFYSDKPASLIVFDGEPVTVPLGQTWPVARGQHQLERV